MCKHLSSTIPPGISSLASVTKTPSLSKVFKSESFKPCFCNMPRAVLSGTLSWSFWSIHHLTTLSLSKQTVSARLSTVSYTHLTLPTNREV